jgi:Zn-dependent metalloprotease
MANPHNNGFNPDKKYDPATNNGQPDNYDELVKVSHTICGGFPAAGDSGCVHFNSGILSKAMVSAIDGFSVNGTKTQIARNKVEQIMFRTLLLGGVITSSSNLKDTAAGAVTACGQLAQAGQFGITTQDCTALKGAFNAVKFNLP